MTPIVLSGSIEHGEGKGRLAGFPTANLHTEQVPLPAYGVYCSVFVTEDSRMHPGVSNIGTRPTADDSSRPTVETWIPNYEGDLYGEHASVVLLDYLRGIRPFSDMAALKQQIDQDAAVSAGRSGQFIANAVISASAENTRLIGRHIASKLRRGDVITLSGPLGAGKSEFVRGIARGLGIEGTLPSPTFTILNVYDRGRLILYHYDWYRIEDPEELIAIGVEEHLPGDGVTMVEWSEQAPELLPEQLLSVNIIPLGGEKRLLYFEPSGGFRPVEEWLTELKKQC